MFLVKEQLDTFGTLIILINILAGTTIQETQKFHTQFGIYEKEEQFLLTDHLEMHFIELSKLNEKTVAEMTEMEQWMTWVKYGDDPEKATVVHEIIEKKESIRMANEILKKISSDEVMREQIRAYELAEHDQATREYFARDEGKQEGEKEKAIEIARNLLDILDDETIANKTGLSILDIKKLRAIQ